MPSVVHFKNQYVRWWITIKFCVVNSSKFPYFWMNSIVNTHNLKSETCIFHMVSAVGLDDDILVNKKLAAYQLKCYKWDTQMGIVKWSPCICIVIPPTYLQVTNWRKLLAQGWCLELPDSSKNLSCLKHGKMQRGRVVLPCCPLVVEVRHPTELIIYARWYITCR